VSAVREWLRVSEATPFTNMIERKTHGRVVVSIEFCPEEDKLAIHVIRTELPRSIEEMEVHKVTCKRSQTWSSTSAFIFVLMVFASHASRL